MTQLNGPAIDIVERAYDMDASTPAWLDAIRDATERSFCGQLCVHAYAFHIGDGDEFRLMGFASEPSHEEGFRLFHTIARPDTIRRIYMGGPVRSAHSALTDPMSDPAWVATANNGVQDIWAAIGLDPSGMGFGLAFLQDHVTRHLSRPTRLALARLAAHLGTALRLRGTLEQGTPNRDIVTGLDAVLAADGKVLHAEGDARTSEARLALRDAARRMDRARLRAQRADPETGLDLWRALVDGRWSLVERFESDGRRVLVARRNDPTTRPSDVLTELERKVVALIALGHSIKYCGYELGRATSTIHDAMNSAMRKLGVRSRPALVEVHGVLVASGADPFNGLKSRKDEPTRS